MIPNVPQRVNVESKMGGVTLSISSKCTRGFEEWREGDGGSDEYTTAGREDE